ncbi:general substrate transporter [Gymnopilus junonius]|uniref:General substrate transporter n=1 Tax=Gymnopilus junonius TaxID=109634 RepID=A0A9P5N988_GYMJU|nr:general substrate transporter [Gymnopilus junonius]
MPNGTAFTVYGWAVCFWSLIVPFQYGYHISVLNQIQAVLTCKATTPQDDHSRPTDRLVPCLPMSDFTFSFLTVIFSIGGLAGSLVAGPIIDRWGRKGTNRICTILIAVGAIFMGLGNSVTLLLFGRFLIGVASGLGLCVGPIYLAEIAPSEISGSVGVLTQLSIVFGIMVTQFAGLTLASPSAWRFVFFISFCLSVFQFFSSSMIVESPTFLLGKHRLDEHKDAARRLWGNSIPVPTSEDSPLDETEESHLLANCETISVTQLFARPDLRRPLLIVSLAMFSQQVSGINAVLYYSNDILAKSLPKFGAYISVGITVINVIMTFPPVILIEKMGRKRLLAMSSLGGLISLSALGFGLDSGSSTLSSLAIVTFVMSFAIGLGPVPFVMIPEVSPQFAVSALSSMALSVNWISNFFVGLTFLPLRNFLAKGDMYKEGRVFYLFVVVFALSIGWLFRFYRG